MAEQVLRHEAAARGLSYEVRSAGTAAESWFEVPAVVKRLLAARGLPPFEHKARLVTRDALRWADEVLVMTADHRDHLVDRFPEFSGKIDLLREKAGFGEQDVADPMGKPDEVFVRCLAVLSESIGALLARHAL